MAALTAAEARQQAQAEGLTLLLADNNKTGYFGVLHMPGRPKPYLTQVRRGGQQVSLGSFATAEEAALAFARHHATVRRGGGGRLPLLTLPQGASRVGRVPALA